jgi:hypothetical protein
MTTTVSPLRLRKVLGRTQWQPPIQFGPDGWKMLHRNGTTSVIVSCAPFDDGHEYIHASIAHTVRMPSYDELCLLHRAVFGDGYAYQVFAPRSQHVNIHHHALHLWGRADGKPAMPEFGAWGTI